MKVGWIIFARASPGVLREDSTQDISFDDTMQVWRASDGSLVMTSHDNDHMVSVIWLPDGHSVV